MGKCADIASASLTTLIPIQPDLDSNGVQLYWERLEKSRVAGSRLAECMQDQRLV